MTRHAIRRRALLYVARYAKAHRVVYRTLGDGRFGHVAVAGGAIHTRANVRRVIEFHVRRRLKAINALPGDVFAARHVSGELLDFGLVGRDHLMAGHAEIHAGNARIRPLIHADMAIHALQAVRKMHFVRVSDGLHRLRADAEKFTDGVPDRSVRGSINVGGRHG